MDLRKRLGENPGMVIWKYLLQVEDVQYIEMPEDAKLLSVQVQVGQPCLWALVNENSPMEKRRILTIGTGNIQPRMIADECFIGTYQILGGALVFHVFGG